jgi:hypothetical protein
LFAQDSDIPMSFRLARRAAAEQGKFEVLMMV